MTYHIEEKVLHFKQPAGTSRGVYTTRRSWFVTLTDENGRQGVGECAPLPNLSCDDLPDYGKKLEEILNKSIPYLDDLSSLTSHLSPLCCDLPRGAGGIGGVEEKP